MARTPDFKLPSLGILLFANQVANQGSPKEKVAINLEYNILITLCFKGENILHLEFLYIARCRIFCFTGHENVYEHQDYYKFVIGHRSIKT